MLHTIFFTLVGVSPISFYGTDFSLSLEPGQTVVCPKSNALRQWLHFPLLQLRPLRLQPGPTAPPPLPRPTAPPHLPRFAQPQRSLRPLPPPRPLQRPRPLLPSAPWRGRGAPLL